MTALALACPAAAPTRFERALLLLSARLSHLAEERMLRRARLAVRSDIRADVADGQRDLAGGVRAQMLPR